ncbi:MAG: hypothetical protein P1P84_13695 [Deferrisomatales bacterium]|nr:hypothetical protein [Deferrisomatales bacterium]
MKSKLRAATVHLAVSAAAAGVLLWVLVRIWYPMPYFVADGGWQGIRLVVLVDLVMGPVLSLIIYNRRKRLRTLVLDYALIASLQALALGLGVWTVFQQRTALVVFSDSALYTVSSDTARGLGPRVRELLGRSARVPAFAAVDMSSDPERQQTLRRESLTGGRPLYLRSDLLEPFVCSDLTGWGSDGLDPWGKDAKEAAPAFLREAEELLRELGVGHEQLLFLPMTARYKNLTLVFRRDDCTQLAWLRGWREPGKDGGGS